MARGGGMNGIQFSKGGVHVYSSEDSLENIMRTFEQVMRRYGDQVDDEGEEKSFEEELKAKDVEEEKEVENPWDKAAKKMKKGG